MTAKLKRQENRKRSRLLLIEATLDSLAEVGFARTSVSEIVERAKLSRGMIHLHFSSKDKLLEEAARHASASYFDDLELLLDKSGNSPQEKLEAVIKSDLSDNVLNKRSVRIWFALRGEASVNQAIARYSDTRDKKLYDLFFDAFLDIAIASKAKEPGAVARDAAHGSLALLEGMWTDFFLHPDSFNRGSALRIIFRILSNMFPEHFNLEGAVKSHLNNMVA